MACLHFDGMHDFLLICGHNPMSFHGLLHNMGLFNLPKPLMHGLLGPCDVTVGWWPGHWQCLLWLGTCINQSMPQPRQGYHLFCTRKGSGKSRFGRLRTVSEPTLNVDISRPLVCPHRLIAFLVSEKQHKIGAYIVFSCVGACACTSIERQFNM
jgi:hypothetical protein